MRERRSGTIANFGSIAGWASFPLCGIYCATKAAIGMYTESLRQEVASFGIKVTCIERKSRQKKKKKKNSIKINHYNFLIIAAANSGSRTAGYFRTSFLSQGSKKTTEKRIPELQEATKPMREGIAAAEGNQIGDPVKGAHLLVEALTGTGKCAGKELPPRLPLGSDALAAIGSVLEAEKKTLDSWTDFAKSSDYNAA